MATKVVTMMLALNSRPFFERGVLRALKEAAGGYDHRLLVVDGGSTDGTVEAVKAEFGEGATVISCAERNLAKCRNLALRLAPEDADFYCFVDSDVVVPVDFLSRLIPLFDDPSVGTAEIRAVLEADRPRALVARYYRELRASRARGVGEVEGGATTCIVLRPELARRITLDERFRRAGEDVDLHLKANEAGFKTVADLNDPPAWHLRRASVSEELRRMWDRGAARALNLRLHGRIVKSQGLGRALAAAVATLLAWALLVPAIALAIPAAALPLLALLARQALKLKRPWRIDLAALGLLLSTAYLAALFQGFIRHWLLGR